MTPSPTTPSGGQRRKTSRAVILVDRTARTGITLGGLGIIAAILGILIFILLEALPLFLPGRVIPVAGGPIPQSSAPAIEAVGWSPPLAVALDEYRELGWTIGSAPELTLFDPRESRVLRSLPIDSLSQACVTSLDLNLAGDLLALGTDDGRVVLGRPGFAAEWNEGKRISTFSWATLDCIHLQTALPVLHVTARRDEKRGIIAVAQARPDGSPGLRVVTQEITRSLLGGASVTSREHDLSALVPEPVTSLALPQDAGMLFAGTAQGRIYRFALPDSGTPELEEVLSAGDGQAVTRLAVLLGDATLVVGTANGRVSTWFGVKDPNLGNQVRPFRRIREFPPSTGPITALAVSPRTKSFAVGDAEGRVRVLHNTTHRVLAAVDLPGPAPVRVVSFAPKADGLAVLGEDARFGHYDVIMPHPEVSFRTLFGKVWYEGYSEPDYVWQSTGGSDEFESKISLVPLIFGTLKGTIYAMIFAVPIAILAAIYTTQFMAERVRQFVKPTVEIMAALPSVVLGFLAGLFLAPHLETMVPATFVFLLLLPVVPTAIGVAWQLLPGRIRGSLPLGFELVAVIPIVALTFLLARWLGPGVEQIVFDGSFREWLMGSTGTRYDQRNCIVVGFAMGFAVIPIIFTIVEDSLTAVPRSLIAGSMACGASRWQTAINIILPAAGSGIFSAIMIGFGRAVGETMIVLMATGNTPIMEWSVFNGMRTLSANIAVEMPEAPYRGTLYRILFFAGLLLLLLTSVINTAAEVVRVRLKRKFGNY